MHSARHEEYESPFSARYTSPEMSRLFSAQYKISTFRRLWTALAKAEQKLGLPITHKQVAQLEENIDKIDFALAATYEKRFRHDVMAHIHAYGDQCPDAKPIIHLGATSSYVTDNTDLIQMREALTLLFGKLIHILRLLARLAENEAASPCLAYTHYQPAQPTTIGKRACLWLQDLLLDAHEFERHINALPFLGAKGATGTQASFLALFDNDAHKVKELETLIATHFGFTKILSIASQTYTRKLDLNILNALESFASASHKMATDIRLLAHDGELTESPTDTQVGSSAMPYKRNPIYSERICGLARFVISLAQNPAYTAATQWLERSLDDSSNRRLAIPESFLGADSILNLLIHLLTHLTVDRAAALTHLEAQIPHLAMENILMQATKKGGDRQKIHEKLRKLSGKPIAEIAKELHLDPKEFHAHALIGRAPDQVRDFLKNEVEPFLSRHKNIAAPIASVEM
ncbi:MAG TPA: adenylosuccinate lyase [Chlamydiales bacterium]|nr:adenylosuccinate lyase [Chlamydiales bacterium]